MKTKSITIIAIATALIAATACTNDDNVAVDNNNPVAARITAAMEKTATATPETRAVNANWNKDKIGVIVTSSPGSDMATRYRNAEYATTATTATADFTPADAANTIYFGDSDEPVEFCAYAPYQPSATPDALPGANGIITIDATKQTTPAEQEALDFIIAEGATASKSSPTVAFTKVDDAHNYSFRHVMARLVLKIETPAVYGFDPADVNRISGINLFGLCTGGTFDVKTDPAAGSGFALKSADHTRTADWDIVGYVHNVGPDKNNVMQRTHTLILFPQQVMNRNGGYLDALPITITLDGQKYTNDTDITGDTNANGRFSSGTSYEYTIRLKKNGLEVTGATITDWVDGGGTTGDATQQP